MVKHNALGRTFNPARSKKRRSRRRKSRRSRTDVTDDRCVTVTLKDVGDIDDKQLNTIPSSVEGETVSWGDKPEANSCASYTNPLLQIQNGDFCTVCTKKLLDIHDHEGGDVCDHPANADERRKKVAESILKVFQSITEGRFDDSNMSVVQSKENSEKGQQNSDIQRTENISRTRTKAVTASSKEIECSMSRLSIQVMCTSESTLSTAVTRELNPGWPPEPKLKSDSTTNKKVETVAGALLMELCKVAENVETVPSLASQKKLLLAKESYMPRLKTARRSIPLNGHSALDAKLPDWLQKLCQEEEPKRGILKKTRSHIVVKSKISVFRPLLCTKLSIPWLFQKSLPQITCTKKQQLSNSSKQKSSSYVKHVKNEQRSNKDRTRDAKKGNSIQSARREHKGSNRAGTKVLHAYDTRRGIRYRSSDSVQPCPNPPADVPLRLFASNTIEEVKPLKKRNELRGNSTEGGETNSMQEPREVSRVEEKRVKEVCPKCKSSIQYSIALRRNSPKLRKIKTKAHNVLAYPCKRALKKSNPASRPEKHRQQLERKENRKTRQYDQSPTTKYFIKSFFTGTSTSETTKPPVKTTKRIGRRRKLGAVARTSGIPHDPKKRKASPRRSPRRHAKVDSQSDVEVEIQASKEMDIINHHIRAHKTASGSSPVFHTCFKRLLDKELKAQSGLETKPSRIRKSSKGGYFNGRQPIEVKKFNESIFSCLIPKVFK